MKIVIPYRDFRGSELTYCLRGIERFIDSPEITIIGDKPKWIKNVCNIPFKDNIQNQFRSRNIYDKIMMVEDDFLFFNDDHFLLSRFTADTYHYSGTLISELQQRPNLSDPYRKTIHNTFSVFGDIKNFDTHCPIFYKRETLELFNYKSLLDWTKPQGYCIKSIYCHLAGIEGTPYPDLKIRTPLAEDKIKELIEGRPYFSTADYCLNKPMIKVLDEIFPDKSIYEL